jgi:hypothetical protein
MIQDKVLTGLVDRQTELFNTGTMEEKVKIYEQIQMYKEIMRKEGK